MMVFVLFSLCALFLCKATIYTNFEANSIFDEDPIYDHQTETYKSQFKPIDVTKYHVVMNPFFSPDQAAGTLANLTIEAKETIDVMIPGVKSWIGCSIYDPIEPGGCSVCTLKYEEIFPVFHALVNAIHRGVKVRILTNEFNETCDVEKLDLNTYLQLAGADFRYFTTNTFLHNKFMLIDGKTAMISSINWSYYSITSNRESGIVIEDNKGTLIEFMQNVFNSDFEKGFHKKPREYSQYVYDQIRDKLVLNVTIPPTKTFPCIVKSPKEDPITGYMDVKLFVSPDYSYETLMDGLKEVKSKIELFIYQITDQKITDQINSMKKQGINITIFVSNDIFGEVDKQLAKKMYTQIYNNGTKIRKTYLDCLKYSHQKFWIVDDSAVWLSSGNWSPTDFPDADTFPPYGKGWIKTNRDFNIKVKNAKMVKRFQELFDTDYQQGWDWSPN